MEQRVLLEGCQKKKCELNRDLDCHPQGLDLVEGQRIMTGRREETLALWGPVVTTQTDSGWGVHVFEKPVLGRLYWVLGIGVVVSHFAAVKAEVQRVAKKDLKPCPRFSAAARQVITGDSVCPLW